MTDYAFFLQGSDRWGKNLALLWGHLNMCPLITAISYYVHNPVRALLPHWPKGLGGQRKIPQQHSLPPGICQGKGYRG